METSVRRLLESFGTAEHVLCTFAYHCGEIMTRENLRGFGLAVPNGEGILVSMRIARRADPSGAVSPWDQVEVNGIAVGNRCAARDAYARLCAPILAAALLHDAQTAKGA